MRAKIREEVRDAKFCILVDEAVDESNKEQMTIILRLINMFGSTSTLLENLIDKRLNSNIHGEAKSETKRSEHYTLIDKLIRLVLTLPVSTTTIERAFSAMKLVKTPLHNKMDDDFLTDYSLESYLPRVSHVKPLSSMDVSKFSTGLGVTGGSALIHEFNSREVSNPIHLTVDYIIRQWRGREGTIKAYVSVNLPLGDRSLAEQFQEIPVDLRMIEAERVGLDTTVMVSAYTTFQFVIVK
ncbi:hypothetical protein Ddye_021329 [Dipteronia dyeriana]|uniref:HAT C-terminal dimerisation domain-containing protein n=1 Tax=Dipteronia dyeriana TaxID=168575 RepID=A0AAD9U1F1_9ROSI|nr:hypothetical protein Ddye_021329 [Dipteronia dyeriana]